MSTGLGKGILGIVPIGLHMGGITNEDRRRPEKLVLPWVSVGMDVFYFQEFASFVLLH